MVALQIEDLKAFTAQLFIGDVFDAFLVREVSITTFNTFTINGKVKKNYYAGTEQEAAEYSSWQLLKPFCFSIVKGKRLPEGFQIQLQLAPDQLTLFLAQHPVGISSEHIQGLHVAIRYDNGKLFCVTGTSVSIFTMDKSLEMAWDLEVQHFLKNQQIVFVSTHL